MADVQTGRTAKLMGPKPSPTPEADLASFSNPHFSLNGGFIYVDADAWTTSAAVHQISLATGKEHYVIDGSVRFVLQTGPYRGYLLVQRHKYHSDPSQGSYDPVYLVRPDAKQTFVIPGSGRDDGDAYVQRWLEING